MIAIPIVRAATTVLDIPIGDAIILTCNGSSVPGPSSALWSRNGTLLSNHTTTLMRINASLTTSTLIINSSQHEDAGDYVCTMKNTFSSNSSQSIHVTILGIVFNIVHLGSL